MRKYHTKDLIADNLADIIRQNNIDKITVTELVEKCDISRQTFYYHFRDISDAIDWMITRVVYRIFESSLDVNNLYESIRLLIEKCQKYNKPLNALLNSQKREDLEVSLSKALRRAIVKSLEYFHAGDKILEEHRSMFLDFYTYGIVGIILDNNFKTEKEIAKATDFIYQIVNTQFEEIS